MDAQDTGAPPNSHGAEELAAVPARGILRSADRDSSEMQQLSGLHVQIRSQAYIEQTITDSIDLTIQARSRQQQQKQLAGLHFRLKALQQSISALRKQIVEVQQDLAGYDRLSGFRPGRDALQSKLKVLQAKAAGLDTQQTNLQRMIKDCGEGVDSFGVGQRSVESEQDRLVRLGQLTPFGTSTAISTSVPSAGRPGRALPLEQDSSNLKRTASAVRTSPAVSHASAYGRHSAERSTQSSPPALQRQKRASSASAAASSSPPSGNQRRRSDSPMIKRKTTSTPPPLSEATTPAKLRGKHSSAATRQRSGQQDREELPAASSNIPCKAPTCTFFGSPETDGFCSVCFRQRRTPSDQPRPARSKVLSSTRRLPIPSDLRSGAAPAAAPTCVVCEQAIASGADETPDARACAECGNLFHSTCSTKNPADPLSSSPDQRSCPFCSSSGSSPPAAHPRKEKFASRSAAASSVDSDQTEGDSEEDNYDRTQDDSNDEDDNEDDILALPSPNNYDSESAGSEDEDSLRSRARRVRSTTISTSTPTRSKRSESLIVDDADWYAYQHRLNRWWTFLQRLDADDANGEDAQESGSASKTSSSRPVLKLALSRTEPAQNSTEIEESASDGVQDAPSELSYLAVEEEAREGDAWMDDRDLAKEDYVYPGDNFLVPYVIWQRLFAFQQIAVSWLWELHTQRVGGILGDEMGLGKTVEVISFLAALHYGTKSGKVSDREHHYARAQPIKTHVDGECRGGILIVCPATVLHQWTREFHKWWPPFRVCVLHSHTAQVGQAKVIDIVGRGGPGNVLLTTYASMKKYESALLRHRWHYVILDEGHIVRRTSLPQNSRGLVIGLLHCRPCL
eukprot:m.850308 g.850308  ORF g.850308 m.850308 type:complete len:852 (+) comp59579_c0_seq2:225-2780(+)